VGPPTIGDAAWFNESGSYAVSFDADAASDLLQFDAGNVTFRSVDRDRTYNITRGAEDALIDGGILTLGVAGDPLHMDIGDRLSFSGGAMNIHHGSEVTAGRLRIGGAGLLTLIGAGSSLTTTSTFIAEIGSNSNGGHLSLLDGARAEFGGALVIGRNSGALATVGTVDVAGGSDVSVAGAIALATGGGTEQTAALRLFDPGTTLTQTGAGSLEIGGGVIGDPSVALVSVEDGATLTTSAGGQTIVFPGAQLTVAGGNVNSHGPVVLWAGSMLTIDGGSFDAKDGLTRTTSDVISLTDGTLTISGGEFQDEFDVVGTTQAFSFGGADAGDVPTFAVTNGASAHFAEELSLGTNAELVINGDGFVECDTATISASATVRLSGTDALWRVGPTDHGGATGDTLNVSGTVMVQDGAEINGVFGVISGAGRVTLQGDDATWKNPARLSVNGQLNVFGGELMSGTSFSGENRHAYVGRFVGSDGIIWVGGGTWQHDSDVYIAGREDAPGGTGELRMTHGLADISGTIKIWSGGTVLVDGPFVELRVGTIDHTEGGDFDFHVGTLQVDSFLGDLVNQGGVLAPGPDAGAMTITGNLTQQADARLAIEIGGPSPGGSHDLVTVAGTAFVGGELELSLTGGYSPHPSTVLTILGADSIIGVFDNVATGERLDVTDGSGSFVVNYGIGSAHNPDQIVLTDFQETIPFTADFDADGDVDGQDLAQWRGDFGENAASDADNDGDSDAADFLAWQQQFGSPQAEISTATMAEPASGNVAMLAVMAGASFLRARRRCVRRG
jgi:hypothetical protein